MVSGCLYDCRMKLTLGRCGNSSRLRRASGRELSAKVVSHGAAASTAGLAAAAAAAAAARCRVQNAFDATSCSRVALRRAGSSRALSLAGRSRKPRYQSSSASQRCAAWPSCKRAWRGSALQAAQHKAQQRAARRERLRACSASCQRSSAAARPCSMRSASHASQPGCGAAAAVPGGGAGNGASCATPDTFCPAHGTYSSTASTSSAWRQRCGAMSATFPQRGASARALHRAAGRRAGAAARPGRHWPAPCVCKCTAYVGGLGPAGFRTEGQAKLPTSDVRRASPRALLRVAQCFEILLLHVGSAMY
jgi:hypothetical protein